MVFGFIFIKQLLLYSFCFTFIYHTGYIIYYSLDAHNSRMQNNNNNYKIETKNEKYKSKRKVNEKKSEIKNRNIEKIKKKMSKYMKRQ